MGKMMHTKVKDGDGGFECQPVALSPRLEGSMSLCSTGLMLAQAQISSWAFLLHRERVPGMRFE